jgi:hypothetical protein
MIESLSGLGLLFWVIALPLLFALIAGAIVGSREPSDPPSRGREASSGCFSYVLLEIFGCLWFVAAVSVASSDGFGILEGYAIWFLLLWIVGFGSAQVLLILLFYSLGRLAGRTVTWSRVRKPR